MNLATRGLAPRRLATRRVTMGMVLWVFGLSTTVTLVSLWGRAVATDAVVLETAARELAGAEMVIDRIVGELEELALDEGTPVQGIASQVAGDPMVEEALADLMSEIVTAAMSTDGGLHEVDVASRLEPLAFAVVSEAEDRGIALDETQVHAALSSIEPIVVRSPDQPPIAGSESPTAGALSIATLVGLIGMLSMGGVVVGLSEDRRAMIRSLLHRIAVSALSFSVMLRLGAWAADPTGGSTPLRSALSVLVGSNIWIPFSAAVVAGVGAAILWYTRRRRPTSDLLDTDEPSEELPVLVTR